MVQKVPNSMLVGSPTFDNPVINGGSIGATTPGTGAFTTLTSTGVSSVTANSASAALTVTQTGAGNAFVVEDSASTDSTPFVIDESGRVISGHTASVAAQGITAQMQNHGISAGQGGGAMSTTYWQNNSTGSAILLNKSRSNTSGSFTAVQNGDGLGIVAFGGADGTAIIRAAAIDAIVDGTPGTNDMPGRLVFSTTADGASSPTERMRIDSAGNVGVGGTANSRTKLGVQGTYPATSGVGIGIGLLGNVDPSTATAAYYCVYSSPTVAAGTLPELNYNFVAQGVFTGTVASQSAFKVDNTLVGATNNYGFYSNIAAAANRYNFYAAGTAANYFAGVTGIGVAAASTSNLTVAASTTAVSSLNIPHGAAPTSPVNGDVWSTTAGLFIRINGVTKTVTLT